MKFIVHEAIVIAVGIGRLQGRCSANDFEGPLRASEDEALADLEQHLADKTLVTHRSGRYTYRVVHADWTPALREQPPEDRR